MGYGTRWGREEANVSDAHREKKGGNKVEARVETGVRKRMANGMRSGWGVWWGTWRGPCTEVIQVSYRHDPMSVGNKQGGRKGWFSPAGSGVCVKRIREVEGKEGGSSMLGLGEREAELAHFTDPSPSEEVPAVFIIIL